MGSRGGARRRRKAEKRRPGHGVRGRRTRRPRAPATPPLPTGRRPRGFSAWRAWRPGPSEDARGRTWPKPLRLPRRVKKGGGHPEVAGFRAVALSPAHWHCISIAAAGPLPSMRDHFHFRGYLCCPGPTAGGQYGLPLEEAAMVRLSCPTCHAVLAVPDDQAGRKGPCPKCGQRLLVPPTALNKTVLGKPLVMPSAAKGIGDAFAFNEPSPPTPPQAQPIPQPALPSPSPRLAGRLRRGPGRAAFGDSFLPLSSCSP